MRLGAKIDNQFGTEHRKVLEQNVVIVKRCVAHKGVLGENGLKFVCVAYQTLKKDLGVLVFCDLQILKIADQPIDIVEIEGQHVIPNV
ncbi:MAG: hypothetical protein CFE46_10250 [Burkholderiales bacterium PBB6]|nr:MAG: hypothetical protein CFE46_10250 [Burkholderiales bacterium PBB6]